MGINELLCLFVADFIYQNEKNDPFVTSADLLNLSFC